MPADWNENITGVLQEVEEITTLDNAIKANYRTGWFVSMPVMAAAMGVALCKDRLAGFIANAETLSVSYNTAHSAVQYTAGAAMTLGGVYTLYTLVKNAMMNNRRYAAMDRLESQRKLEL